MTQSGRVWWVVGLFVVVGTETCGVRPMVHRKGRKTWTLRASTGSSGSSEESQKDPGRGGRGPGRRSQYPCGDDVSGGATGQRVHR